MIFVGDVMQHDGQIEAARNSANDTYEYEDGFKFVKPILNQYDLRVANLEVTLAGAPYKGYPQFSAPDELSETLVNSGFNVILTANNHSCDRGSKGVVRTLDVLDKLGVKHTGTFRSIAERNKNYPLMIEENGIRIAMLNYTYGTNGLSVSAPLIINYIDSAVIKKDVERAKELKADYIVCNMHWGTEYKPLPNNYQKRFESYCYDLGVDMVIGGHPHVVQPIEKKNIENQEKLTVWSLGNFVSNMKVRYTRGGVMVGASIKKSNGSTKLKDVNHWFVYVHPKQEGKIKQYYILPDFNYIDYREDFMSSSDLQKMSEFFEDSRSLYAEHTIGSVEKTISEKSAIGALYKSYLKGYYSVYLPDVNDDILLKKGMSKYLHETVDKDGKSYIVSGVASTYDQAKGHRQFVLDCKMSSEPKIVFIQLNNVTRVEE